MAGYPARPINIEDLWGAVACRQACPLHTDAGGYVSLIHQGRYDEARRVAARGNPLVNVCARVCAHGCEKACNRGRVDEPVSICALKRFAVEYGRAAVPRPPRPEREEKVAVVGAGPAGLSAAHDLRLMGYRVTVYERASSPGGMLYKGIPRYRLPEDIIWQDVKAIRVLGVEIRCGLALGRDFTLEDLEGEGYRAVVLALGAARPRAPDLEGLAYRGVRQGLEVLEAFNLGQPVQVGRKVVVLGGGNVAMDVARTALRADRVGNGRREVRLVCLESRSEMPASPDEVATAEEEGIVIHPRRWPARILGRDGHVAGLELLLVKSAYDSSGRLRPIFYPGYRETLEADTVILALGQEPELSFLGPEEGIELTPEGRLAVDHYLATARQGVYAAGDVAFGTRSVVTAVAEGRLVARSVHRYLGGGIGEERGLPRLYRLAHNRGEDPYLKLPRQKEPLLPLAARTATRESKLGFEPERARQEASRCLRCAVMPWLDPGKCLLCGACVETCPYGTLKIASPGRVAVTGPLGTCQGGRGKGVFALLWRPTACVRCGLCAARCPTGALSMVRVEWEEA